MRCALDGAVEFEHGVDAEFPESHRDCGLLGALGANNASRWYSWLRNSASIET
jgi:hypothetical protein